MQTCCSTASPLPTKHLKSLKAQSSRIRILIIFIQVFFLKEGGGGEKEQNKTSPVNRNSLLQTVFAPNPFSFQVSKILVLSHCSDGQSTFQRFCVPLQQREDEWGVEGGREGAAGSSGNPPSITDGPIIKDTLQYTSLGYMLIPN